MEAGGTGSRSEQEFERIKLQKITSQIQAWEDKQKSQIENKAERQHFEVDALRKKNEADREAEMKHIESCVAQSETERLKQLKLEKLKNKEVQAQKEFELKRATIEAQRETERLKIEEKASKFRTTKTVPTSCFGFCGKYNFLC